MYDFTDVHEVFRAYDIIILLLLLFLLLNIDSIV
jgi:hypothetical protein